MRTRTRLGETNYREIPTTVNTRTTWEFEACLAGTLAATLRRDVEHDEVLRSQTLWVFPPTTAHGWTSETTCKRAVFHFTEVPRELAERVPSRGYYRVPISESDASRIRHLAAAALAMDAEPTDLQALHDRGILIELSMMALREVEPRPLNGTNRAQLKVAKAMSWYEDHMAENPGVDQIAHAVALSPTHLRRLFQCAHATPPHEILHQRRMRRAEDLIMARELTLDDIAEQIGFSCASALSRAVKTHFGHSPRKLRQRRGYPVT